MKVLTYKQLNEIKDFMLKIFEELDDDYYDWRKVRIWERAIDRRLKQCDQHENSEAWDLIKWHNDDCVSILEKHGWKVVIDEEYLKKKGKEEN